MQHALSLILIVACATASAEVFQRIGPDGEVYFSDRPGPGAEPIDVDPAQAVSLPAPAPQTVGVKQVLGKGAEGHKVLSPSYAQFSIVKPSSDQGVRANDGSVTVHLSLQPALKVGHTIELSVEGEDGERIHSGDTLNFNLTDMSRGRHTVAARVVNDKGEELIKTGPIGFYVLRNTIGRQGGRGN